MIFWGLISLCMNCIKTVTEMNRLIHDITDKLKYKLEKIGKILVKVDRFFASSQTCSCCGYKNPETKDLFVRAWDCPECGTHHDRDVNAAMNIRNEGMRLVSA